MKPGDPLFWYCFMLCLVAIAVLMTTGPGDGPDDWDGSV